jgi:nitroreductase
MNVIDALQSRRSIRAYKPELDITEDYIVMIGIALGYEDPEDVVNKGRSIRRPVEDAVVFSGF